MIDPYASARAAHRRKTMSVPAAARELNMSPSTAYDWIRRGLFPVPVHGDGGRRYVITADLDRHLGTQPVPTPLSVVPSAPAPLLDALAHVRHQVAWWQYQQAQLEAQIAADAADDRQVG